MFKNYILIKNKSVYSSLILDNLTSKYVKLDPIDRRILAYDIQGQPI